MKVLISLFFISNIYASDFIKCDVKVEILKKNEIYSDIKILKVNKIPTGFGNCNFIVGDLKSIKIEGDLKKGIHLLHFYEYSGMTPNGAIHSIIWQLKNAKKKD